MRPDEFELKLIYERVGYNFGGDNPLVLTSRDLQVKAHEVQDAPGGGKAHHSSVALGGIVGLNILFGLPIVASAAAMIYAPSALAKTLAARAFSGLGAFYTRYCGRRLAVFQCAPAVSGWVRSRHWKGTRPPVPLRDLISCGCRVCRPASRTERSRGEQCYRGSRCMRRIYLPAVPLHPTATATGVRVREDKRMIMDGQFVKMRQQLGGSCLVEAGDRNEAIEIAARIPADSWGRVEIRPVVEISDLRRRIRRSKLSISHLVVRHKCSAAGSVVGEGK